MFKLLIDTCVWLDLAKDHQQESLLGVLEELLRQKKIELLLPQTICDEFARNKARIAEEGGRSHSGILKRVKEIVDRFGDPGKKRSVLEQLNEVDHRIPLLGDKAVQSIGRIEKLFDSTAVLPITDAVKLRAAQRGIDKKAPFHRQRNGIDDAILIEIYSDCISRAKPGERFAFISHNTKDFSHPTANDQLPHPDIQGLFSKIKSLYSTRLAEVLKKVAPDDVSDMMLEHEWAYESRKLVEIGAASEELLDKIWYNRHQNLRIKIETGAVKLTDDKEGWRKPRTVLRTVWEGARKSAKRVEKKYGKKNLGPWDDFEWGMLNGKLSALRWVLGEEWDMLDT